MRFAIFVREGDQSYDKVNEIPEQLRKRTLAVRSFDTKGMMVDNRLVDGQQIEPVIEIARAVECRLPAYSLCGSWLLRRKGGEGLVI
jgi:hypothetical protein